ncbi:c-type cytochrome biogenesis protein CcmI [Parasutterella muris]|uniref:c-type cytochrome biogenesis protein CcmI n=1 Tax=Parasutterella muris TaxID=2565572 RepID=UPI00203E3B84|nr:c-type cytochrome biogenesis protein CcmI [Parasutterella muris]
MTDNMSQILFYGAAVGLLLILEAAVWRGFKSSAKRRSDSASDALTLNRIVYRDELNELNADLACGRITQMQFESAVREVERRALEENATDDALSVTAPIWSDCASKAILLLLPILALSLYFLFANPSLNNYCGTPNAQKTEQYDASYAKTVQKYLKESPKDVRAWVFLSNYHASRQEPSKALEAMNKAFEYSPRGVASEPGHILQRALLMLDTHDPMQSGNAMKEIERALTIAPEDTHILEIGGSAAYTLGDYRTAVRYWSTLLELIGRESPRAAQILDAISDARNRESMSFGSMFIR